MGFVPAAREVWKHLQNGILRQTIQRLFKLSRAQDSCKFPLYIGPCLPNLSATWALHHPPPSAAEVDDSGLQCDQQEPACGQCEKRQQTCPGYRNIVDLMFRDESSHVIQKATKKVRSRTIPPPDIPTPSPSRSASKFTTTLTWSPNESTWRSGRNGRPRKSPSSTCSTFTVSAPGRSNSGTLSPAADDSVTQFQLLPTAKLGKVDSEDVKKEPGESSPHHVPAFVPCSLATSFEDRGLNLFIARYVSIV